MPRLNIFESFPLNHDVGGFGRLGTDNNTLRVFGVYIPGSISFNNIIMAVGASGTTAKTLTLSFGLYSLNGATLSLANSASFSSNPAANQSSWRTFVTSATQDITPGNWYFAINSVTAGNSEFSVKRANNNINIHGVHGGPFLQGYHSVSQTAMPASIATSDFVKDGASSFINTLPYILISA